MLVPVRQLVSLTTTDQEALLARGKSSADSALADQVAQILAGVRSGGVAAVLDYTKKFDKVALSELEVSAAELAAVDPDAPEFDFLRAAAANLTKFHAAQLAHVRAEPKVTTQPGITVWREWRPIERVGIYAPGGMATYPSSVLMQAIPAALAGCREIVLATPPRADGSIAPVVLAAARISGVTRIIKAGGAQAIAALRYIYGAELLTGPGNAWVTTAKQQLSLEVAIDMPAGPSEVLVLADETADPAHVAADLLSQLEHAPDAVAVLVSTSADLAKQVSGELDRQAAQLSRQEILKKSLATGCQIIVADDLDSALDWVNAFAPEHLEIIVRETAAVLPRIVNAGSVFVGPYASEPAGDFATGSNHVLPTAGFARNFSALSVETFGKKIQFQELTRSGLQSIKEVCEKFGELEGLDAHARSVSIRFED